MLRSIYSIAAACTLCAARALAQTPAPASPPPSAPSSQSVRSHVERFSTPAVRAERAEAEATAKLKANPQDAASYNARSLSRMMLGRYEEAYGDLQQAVSLQPANAEYRANLGYVLWKLGRASEAISAERAALKLNDKSYTGNYQLGRFLLRTGDPKLLPEAAEHLRRALEIDPRQYEVRFELLAVYRSLGDTAQATAQLDLLQDARPSDPRVDYVSALLAADRNDMNGAIKGFQEALRRDPALYGAWQDLGLAYIKLNRWTEAVETFAELTKRQPDSVDASYFYALSLFNVGRVEESEREVRRTLRLDAGAAAAHTLLGIILASRGGANLEASDALVQAIELNPNDFDAHFYLGRVQYTQRDYIGAARNLREAVKLNPRHNQARFFLGTVLEAQGEAEAAMAEYREIVKNDPQSAMGQVGLGTLLVKEGKIEEAIAALKRAVSLDQKSFEAYLSLGRAQALAEHLPEAVSALQTATALGPERVEAHYQLGLVLKRLGRNEEAAREFALVNQLNTEFRTNTAPPKK